VKKAIVCFLMFILAGMIACASTQSGNATQQLTQTQAHTQEVVPTGQPSTSTSQSTSTTPPTSGSQFNPNISYGTFTDLRDSQTYRTVRIGNLTWMAQNLNFVMANSHCYDNDNSNCDKYGRLYTWDAAMETCPVGWRLPTRQDWEDLVREADGRDAAGSRLKSQTGWSDNGNGTDRFGFSALPGGIRFGGSFNGVGTIDSWWSATEGRSGNAWFRYMGSGSSRADELSLSKSNGFSVRCVSD